MSKLREIFVKLGLDKDNGLFITSENTWQKETALPNRVRRLLENRIRPDAFFCFDNKPMILFFNKPNYEDELHQAIWNFNECPIAIIIRDNIVEIFNGFNYLKNERILQKLGGDDKLKNFTYFKLVTGKTWEEYEKELNYKNRVDYHLLDNIKTARKVLVEQHKLDSKIANAIIGKSIFVRYLIDRKVKMKFDDKLRKWTNEQFCELLDKPNKIKQFFDYLEDKDKGFNGDLFPLTNDEYKKVSKDDYEIIRRLLKGETIEEKQLSLFEFYDFSIIPIEFISNVYELFIGENNQKKEGAYYTPLFLVDYILKETVEKHLNQGDSSFKCKVLDPACGSGIFLVETLRKIIEKYIVETRIDIKSEKFKTALKRLVKENIYGIDKDESAMQVAIFSVYLTLLDYLEPPSIETFTFPELIDTNFFNVDYFDESSSFNKYLKELRFDFILGNPPWFRGKGEKEKPLYVEYIEKRKNAEKDNQAIPINIGNREIAQAFLLRASDFSNDKTKCALIVTSKVLYNLQSVSFRKYFLDNYLIERVLELAPVRREVFDKSNDKSIAPACIIFFNYAKSQNTDSNIVEHIAIKPSRFFSLFKIFVINRADFKKVLQKKLKEFDLLWKIMVYGSYLDFNFIQRLKDNYTTINDYFEKNAVLIKQGIKRKDGLNKIDVSELYNWDFLDLNKKEIQQLYIKPNHAKWTIKEVGYIYKENGKICKDIFTPPLLLVKETVNNKMESVSAITLRKILFTDKVTSIKIRSENDTNQYYVLAALMNSTLFAYFVLNTSSTAGVMIEQQINDIERFTFPYIYDKKLVTITEKIESLKQEDFGVADEVNKLNSTIFNLFDLDKKERALVDYAKDIMIPLTMRHKGYKRLFKPLQFKDNFLENYANLFIEHFKPKLDTNKYKFTIEIWHTQQIIGMFFKIVPLAKYSQTITWVDKQNKDTEILTFLIGLGSEKITDNLFIQKDLRGFSKNDFFIFKPNEKRLWHQAIGYWDVNEFSEAMLKQGRKSK